MSTDNNQAVAANQKKRKPVMAIITTVFVLAGIGYAFYYATVLTQREETDNAYVGGNLVTLTSQVSGTVTQISADETQFVKAGDDVVKLDPVDAKVALAQAEAALGDSVRQLRQSYANASQYDAALAQKRIDLPRRRMIWRAVRRWPLTTPCRPKKLPTPKTMSPSPKRRWM